MPDLIPIGRLAPSPTGAQHVGNARTYLLAWLSIRSRGGRVVLRIEDIDSPRVKAGAAQQALDDLAWLGLDWDEGPDVGGAHGPYVQTERLEHYQAAFESLRSQQLVYPCTCSRSDVAAAASAPHAGQEGPIYPGTCADRSAEAAADLGDRPFVWRFRTSEGEDAFVDRLAGPVRCDVRCELGDFVIAKRDRTPSYQLAVVVDDHAQGITEVVRGDDLLPSAFRQRAIARALGWNSPEFAHAGLVVGPDGRRLAKRHGDTRLSQLREKGYGPEALLGLLAWSAGLRSTAAPTVARDLLEDFSLDRIQRGPFVLTSEMWSALADDRAWSGG